MKEPVDHILRSPLPWRDSSTQITECGCDPAQVRAITRDEYLSRVKEMGPQRASLFTCMTCASTADRWSTWDQDPRLVLYREIEWERGGAYYHERTDRGQALKDELLAIADLIAAHREEFDTAVRTTEARREWNEKKAAMGRAQ